MDLTWVGFGNYFFDITASELNELTSLQDRGLSQGAGLGVLAAAFQER